MECACMINYLPSGLLKMHTPNYILLDILLCERRRPFSLRLLYCFDLSRVCSAIHFVRKVDKVDEEANGCWILAPAILHLKLHSWSPSIVCIIEMPVCQTCILQIFASNSTRLKPSWHVALLVSVGSGVQRATVVISNAGSRLIVCSTDTHCAIYSMGHGPRSCV